MYGWCKYVCQCTYLCMYATTHTNTERRGERVPHIPVRSHLTVHARAFSHLDFGCHCTGEIKAKDHNDDLPAESWWLTATTVMCVGWRVEKIKKYRSTSICIGYNLLNYTRHNQDFEANSFCLVWLSLSIQRATWPMSVQNAQRGYSNLKNGNGKQSAPQTWWQKEGQAKYSIPGLVRCLSGHKYLRGSCLIRGGKTLVALRKAAILR